MTKIEPAHTPAVNGGRVAVIPTTVLPVLICSAPLLLSTLNLQATMSASLHPLSPFIKIPGIAAPISVESISHFESFGNYSRLFFVGKTRPIVSSQTLKLFELQLPDFLRVSKSYLVNPRHISASGCQDGRSLELMLANQASVLVARRRVERIRTQLSTPGTH